MRGAGDQEWALHAAYSREALKNLGYIVGPECLPDEPSPCGGSFAQHAVAHLAAIRAVATHQLAHLGAPEDEVRDIETRILAELQCDGLDREEE